MSLYAYAAAALVALVLLAGSHWRAYVAGGDGVRVAWANADKERSEAAIELERETRRAVDAVTRNARKERERAQAQLAALRNDLRDGRERLSVAVASCPAGDPGTGHQQARAALLPEVAARLVDLAGDADQAVRELNECIDKYNAVRGEHGRR